MADVQTGNGFTRIANGILENIAKLPLNGTQLKILLVVWRSTYGYQKKTHSLSITYIQKACNCSRESAKKEIKKLIDNNILVEESSSTHTDSRKISFNKDYESYKIGVAQLNHSGIDIPQVDYSSIPQGYNDSTPQGYRSTPKKETIKKSIKKEYYDIIFQHYLSLDLIKHKALTESMKKSIDKAMKDNSYTVEDCISLLSKHDSKVKETKDNEKPITIRSLDSFFGQKVYNAQHLICSEYEDGRKYGTVEREKPKHFVPYREGY